MRAGPVRVQNRGPVMSARRARLYLWGMDAREWLGQMIEHMEWADAAVIESLRRQGGSAKAAGIMAHIVGAERVWLSRVRPQSADRLPIWPELPLEECRRLAAENARAFADVVARAGSEGLSRPVSYANSKGQPFSTRLDDILLQVFLHGSYHRGQIALLQRMDGQEPVLTDYIHFRRSVRG